MGILLGSIDMYVEKKLRNDLPRWISASSDIFDSADCIID